MTEKELAGIIARGIGSVVEPLLARVKTLEAEVGELKQREYQGAWEEAKAYARGAMVTRDGSIWHSNVNENRSQPGQHPHWTLAVKRGKDAR